MSSGWHVALAYALTGEELALPGHSAPEPAVLLQELVVLGWDAERLRLSARRRHQVPAELRQGLGAAQYAAALAELRRLLGATGAQPRVRDAQARPDATDRRLLQDRPPHWG